MLWPVSGGYLHTWQKMVDGFGSWFELRVNYLANSVLSIGIYRALGIKMTSWSKCREEVYNFNVYYQKATYCWLELSWVGRKYICAVHSKSQFTPEGTVYLSKIDYTVLIQSWWLTPCYIWNHSFIGIFHGLVFQINLLFEM